MHMFLYLITQKYREILYLKLFRKNIIALKYVSVFLEPKC